jgi:hypothetical protein
MHMLDCVLAKPELEIQEEQLWEVGGPHAPSCEEY